MTIPQASGTRYGSEEIWRRSLATQFDNLHRPRPYPVRDIQQIHDRTARIWAGGLPAWRAHYEAAVQGGALPAVTAPGRWGG